MTRETIITCECCGLKTDPTKSRELTIAVSFLALKGSSKAFDFCEDCIAKVAGHGADDNRCFKSIAHQSQQAVLAMFKSEVKKFDTAAEVEGGGK